MIVGRVVGGNFSFSRSVCLSVDSAGISRVLIKYSGKYVKIDFNMKITYIMVISFLDCKVKENVWQPFSPLFYFYFIFFFPGAFCLIAWLIFEQF